MGDDFVLKWWCGEDRLQAKLSRTYTYSFHHFIIFFYCTLIGVQVSSIPILEVIGTWFEVREAAARQGWLGPVGLEDSPGANFDSSPW